MCQPNKENAVMSRENSDKLAKAWSDLTHYVDHDLAASLFLISAAAGWVERLLPPLMEAYQVAVEKKIIQEKVTQEDLEVLKHSFPEILRENNKIRDLSKSAYLFSRELLETSSNMNAKETIIRVLNNYPFVDEAERSLVQVDDQNDFEFKCAPVFMDALLAHFLNNALRHIKQVNKGNIAIWTESDQSHHLIHFKDTAGGMHPYTFPNIFNRFFSKRNNTLVPGMGYCRLAILQQGGDVVCEAIQGEYTHFTVKLAF